MINKNNLYKYANSIDNSKTKKMDNVGKSNKSKKMDKKTDSKAETEKSAAVVKNLAQNAVKALKSTMNNSVVPSVKSIKAVQISPEMKNKIKDIAGKSAIPAATALGGMAVGGGLKELQNDSEKSNPTVSDISERIYNLLRNYIGKLFS